MATYWLDPFLEATTQGNGTTDTSTRDGAYASPYSLLDFSGTSSTVTNFSFADGDELRIKGLSFSTLFETMGNVYAPGTGGVDTYLYGYLTPVTGNTDFVDTLNTTKSCCFAFQNSDISTYFPNWSHPFFFVGYGNNTSRINTPVGTFHHAVVKTQLGHGSASDTGIELFRVKDTYANVITHSSNIYFFNISYKVTLSAGWTSETAQGGYSILETAGSSSGNLYILGNANNKIKLDCERLLVVRSYGFSGVNSYNGVYVEVVDLDARVEATDHIAPQLIVATYWQFYLYVDTYPGSTTTWPMVSGGKQYSGAPYITYQHTSNTSRTGSSIIKNYVSNWSYIYVLNSNNNHAMSFGNFYGPTWDGTDGNNRIIRFATSGVGPLTFLQDSVYYMIAEDNTTAITIDADPIYGNGQAYQTGLKQPGAAPLANVSLSNTIGPSRGATLNSSSSGAELFTTTKNVGTGNSWFESVLGRTGFNPIEYTSLLELTCNTNDYRTTAHNIAVLTGTALGATDAPKYSIFSAESNDFDGKPLSIIGDPYTAGVNYGALLYNDVVSSTSVLVGQWSGNTASASTQSWIPLELSVPTYTAGVSNLRVTVSSAYADGASNSAAGSILLRAWHRDDTQSDNFRVYSSSATAISAGGNPSSTTTVTLNLSNVQTSGQEKITSVIVGIRLDFTSNTNIQKYYITNAAIETY
tara:strand:- start:989 stop:3073 length:2085 start_codon:yes stop_codon:yes gene_type:complete